VLRAVHLSATMDGEPLFAKLDLTINPGDRIGVVGPNGVGKTTLLRVLSGELPPQTGHVALGPADRIGYAPERAADPDATLGEVLAETPGELAELSRLVERLADGLPETLTRYAAAQERFAQLGGWAYAARVDAVRSRLGIADLDQSRPMGAVSGGEQARVLLARVLLSEPTVLLLDEPTAHLDADGVAWLGGYLADFPGGMLVVTHDRAFLDRFATRVLELDGIHPEPASYEGGYTAYRRERQRRWERLLLEYEAQEKSRRRLAEDIERTRGQALGVEQTTHNDRLRRYAKKVARKAKARERRLERQMRAVSWLARPQTRPAMVVSFGDGVPADAPVIRAVGMGLPGRLRPVDLTVRGGDRVLITGANGAGKSTLLRGLSGAAGFVGEVARLAPTALLPQSHDRLPAGQRVLEFFRSRVPMYVEDAEATLEAFLFDAELRRQPVGSLSAGQTRRLLLATMVNSRAEVLLLDEPTSFLDFDSLDVVEAALREFPGTLLLVTHDTYFAKAVGPTRRLIVEDGSVREPSAVASPHPAAE
jgi:ATPase subunit of ABC transporter with duplicated ATPase domains